LAADRFSLLNDRAREAVALHNLAQAEREMDDTTNALKHLTQAASLNERAGRTNAWWRDQIALLQVEAESAQTQALKSRPQLPPLEEAKPGPDHSGIVGGVFEGAGKGERSRVPPPRQPRNSPVVIV
jgi:hypothetical protein